MLLMCSSDAPEDEDEDADADADEDADEDAEGLHAVPKGDSEAGIDLGGGDEMEMR